MLSKLSSIDTECREFLDSVLDGYNLKERVVVVSQLDR